MKSTTSSALVPFDYEGSQLRVFADEHGDPWFVVTDLCSVLGIGNPRQATNRLDADEKGVISTDTPGGVQAVATVNEPGLYTLVLGSRKPEAKRFKRWVTHEVLPAIRRTGRYAVPVLAPTPASLPSEKQDSVGALLLIGQAVAQVPGVKPGIAMAATLTCIEENTGLAIETLRRALPAAQAPICSLNATQLGQRLGMAARVMNQHLAACGLQLRNARDEWELSERGQQWAEALPYCRQGHSGYQILWNPAVVDIVRGLG
ncbi:MAG: Bro-N domain-containing protein [Cyanobacteria bacterium]|nr:Bro-N domain-containing protein [Cyanobacteriota bacterium]